MTYLKYISALLLLAAIAVGCSGSKSFAKKAGKLDQAGMYAEAADMYLQAVQRNKKNVDAKIGLKQTGQKLLEDKLSTFFKSVAVGDAKGQAVSTYLDAKAYQERVERLGVILEIPDHYRSDFDKVKGEYLIQLYSEGQALLEVQDFPSAERKFSEIAKLEPGYKDASSLQAVAYLEPLYRTGKGDLAAGNYRKAYNALNKVVTKDQGFKDASVLLQECLTKGQYSIAVLPFTGSAAQRSPTAKVQAYAMTALTETKDPFLKIVDRENMERILEEQRLGLSGVVDEQTAVRVGNLMGAKAVLMGEVVEYREEAGKTRSSTKDGYTSYRVQQVNAEGQKYFETKYKPVKYVEYLQTNKVILSFSYRLVSLETGEILASKVVDRTANDELYYATYDGDKNALYPMANGAIDMGNNSRNQLRSLLSAKRDIKPVSTLSNDAIREATATMAATVLQDLNTKLP